MSAEIAGNNNERLEKQFEGRVKGVQESASHLRILGLTLLGVIGYVSIVFAGVTDADLVLGTKLKLPVLDVMVPAYLFLVVSSLVVIVLHWNHLYHLNQFVRRFIAMQEFAATKYGEEAPTEGIPTFVVADAATGVLSGSTTRSRSWWVRLTILLGVSFAPLLVVWSAVEDATVMQSFWANGALWVLLLGLVGTIREWVCFVRLLLRSQKPDGVLTAIVQRRSFWGVVAYLVLAAVVSGSLGWLAYNNHRPLNLAKAEIVGRAPDAEIVAAYLMSGRDVSEAWMEHGRGFDLSNLDLQYADLRDAKLWKATLPVNRLQGVVLEGAELHGAQFVVVQGLSKKIDLRLANLAGVDLTAFGSLADADLSGANLFQAKLHGVDLRRANLTEANLQQADLRGADLSGAKLQGADLSRADLRWANLFRANCTDAELDRALLDDAFLYATVTDRSKGYIAWIDTARRQDTNTVKAVLERRDKQRSIAASHFGREEKRQRSDEGRHLRVMKKYMQMIRSREMRPERVFNEIREIAPYAQKGLMPQQLPRHEGLEQAFMRRCEALARVMVPAKPFSAGCEALDEWWAGATVEDRKMILEWIQ